MTVQTHGSSAVAAAETSSKPLPSYVSVSDNYAVIDVGGVQHLVEEGRWYTCNRLNVRLYSSYYVTSVHPYREVLLSLSRPSGHDRCWGGHVCLVCF